MPERTAAYISQHDLHTGEMTVRETLAFSARCQGVGSRYGRYFDYSNLVKNKMLLDMRLQAKFSTGLLADMLAELSRREKMANIKPDPDIDIYMKVQWS